MGRQMSGGSTAPESSCLSCAARRWTCNGAHPICARCAREHIPCNYVRTVETAIASLFPRWDLSNRLCSLTHRESTHTGGFARIFKGRLDDDRAIAVKVLDNRWLSAREIELSVREALLWRGLDHPKIVPFLGVANFHRICMGAQPQLCIISPWMSGGNIMEYIGSNPNEDRLILLKDVVLGLDYLHQAPMGRIIHGDLKGNNILVDLENEISRPIAKITDFGLSLIAEPGAQETTSSSSLAHKGNCRWLAPERMLPERFGLTIREAKSVASDIFELSRTFYEVLTGHHPFRGMSDVAVTLAVLQNEHPSRPSDYCRGLDDVRWELMKLAWQQDAGRRPSLAEIAQDLEQSLTLESHLTGETVPLQRVLALRIPIRRITHEKERIRSLALTLPLFSTSSAWVNQAQEHVFRTLLGNLTHVKSVRFEVHTGEELLAPDSPMVRLLDMPSVCWMDVNMVGSIEPPVLVLGRNNEMRLTTLVVRKNPMTLDWSTVLLFLRNLEVKPDTEWHMNNWHSLFSALLDAWHLERLVISNEDDCDEPWVDAWLAIAGGNGIHSEWANLSNRGHRLTQLRTFKLESSSLHMAITCLRLFRHTSLKDLSLAIAYDPALGDLIADYWPRLMTLAWYIQDRGSTDIQALPYWSYRLDVLDIFELDHPNTLQMLAQIPSDGTTTLPNLKLLRIYYPLSCDDIDLLASFLRRRADGEGPLQKLQVNRKGLQEMMGRVGCLDAFLELSGMVEVGWYEPCWGFRGFTESLNAESGAVVSADDLESNPACVAHPLIHGVVQCRPEVTAHRKYLLSYCSVDVALCAK